MENQSHLKEILLRNEENLLKPEVRTSQKELHNLLAEDFFEIGSSGRVLYKGVVEVELGIVKMKLTDFEIHPLSEEIVLTTYRIYDEIKDQHSLRSSIWKQIDGSWKMVFHQGTKTNSGM